MGGGEAGGGSWSPPAAWPIPADPALPSAIQADGRDVKSLFRRSQALQKLGRPDQALLDLQRCLSLEPKNKAFQEALRSLGSCLQEKVGQGQA